MIRPAIAIYILAHAARVLVDAASEAACIVERMRPLRAPPAPSHLRGPDEPPAAERAEPANPDAPPEGVCIARASEAEIAGKRGDRIACPVHHVAPGEPCPEQWWPPTPEPIAEYENPASPRSDTPKRPDRVSEDGSEAYIVAGQERSGGESEATIRVVAHHPDRPDCWEIERTGSPGTRYWYTPALIEIHWPNVIAPKAGGRDDS